MSDVEVGDAHLDHVLAQQDQGEFDLAAQTEPVARQIDSSAVEDAVNSGDEFGHVIAAESCSRVIAHR